MLTNHWNRSVRYAISRCRGSDNRVDAKASGSANRWLGTDPVRYMSVTTVL